MFFCAEIFSLTESAMLFGGVDLSYRFPEHLHEFIEFYLPLSVRHGHGVVEMLFG